VFIRVHPRCQTACLAAALLAAALSASAASEPQRIVSLAPSLTETVFALGVGDRLVGVSIYCDFPPEAARIDRVGSFITPNVEAIVAKKPDLVLAVPSPGNRSPVESLERLGFKVVVVDPETLDGIKESIVTVGEELGRATRAREVVAEIDRRIDATRAKLAGVVQRKVLMVVGQTPLIVAGAATVQDEIIRLAGGVNLGAAAGKGWPHVSIEYAIDSAPEVIIDSTMGSEVRAGGESSAFWKAFPTIPAVKEGRISGYKAYEVLRPGPRIGEALEVIARFIHPERFDAGDDH
jgi:iron complex transport system substrate-binding protein